ncbi:MAG TPA: hypothetical protein VGQ62_00405 [Chloroflexota bacterium]|nr:hypothetical protein [Chloroflexota bacterium]
MSVTPVSRERDASQTGGTIGSGSGRTPVPDETAWPGTACASQPLDRTRFRKLALLTYHAQRLVSVTPAVT